MALLGTACSGKAGDSEEAFVFRGQIEGRAVDELVALLGARQGVPTKIIFDSPGGTAPRGMDIGDAVRGHGNVTIVVSQLCHSACVQYVLPSARKVIIEKNASIAFHDTPSTLGLPADAPTTLVRLRRMLEARERTFYTARGIDVEQLRRMQSLITTFCRIERKNVPKEDVRRYGNISRFHVVVPSLAVVQSLGFRNLSGYWPASYSEARSDALKNGMSPQFSIRFVESRVLAAATPIKRLPECPSVPAN